MLGRSHRVMAEAGELEQPGQAGDVARIERQRGEHGPHEFHRRLPGRPRRLCGGEAARELRRGRQPRRLAAERLHGVTIEPGAIWSFNRTVGRRDVLNGYRIAPTLTLQGKEPALGGGVCQVSTTVFNALLLADLGIEERHPHSRPVRYVALGRDAAVDWGSKDLKVKNHHPFPLKITAQVDGGRLTTRLFGPRALVHDVVIEVGDLEPAAPRKELQVLESPDDLAVGGVWVKLYRKRMKDGSVFEVERVGKPSFYPWKVKVPVKPR